MKKVIIVILILLLTAGTGVFGFLWYKSQKETKQLQDTVAMLSVQSSPTQTEGNSSTLTAYTVSSNLRGGSALTQYNVSAVELPVEAVTSNTITSTTDLEGKFLKLDTKPGTIITKDLITDTMETINCAYTREIQFTALPVGLVEGDYVDIRMILPNGENYKVLTHKQVKYITQNVLTFEFSEEENVIWDSALNDYATYQDYGLVLYLLKYLEPGRDFAVANYPVSRDLESYVTFDTNVEDPTRCINSTLRDHIDQTLFMAATSDNSNVSTSISALYSVQLNAGQSAYETFKEDHTDEDGNYVAPDSTEEDSQSYTDDLNETVDELEENLDELGDL